MAILVGRETRVICQGMTGRAATFHVGRMLELRHPHRRRRHARQGRAAGISTCRCSIRWPRRWRPPAPTPAWCSCRPTRPAGAMIEAIRAGVPLVVCVTERVPLLDMVRVRQALDGTRTRLVGPNSQGVLAPGMAQLGVMATTSASERAGRHRLALGVADQRDRGPGHQGRARPVDHGRHRRRSRARADACPMRRAVRCRTTRRRASS